MKLRNMTSLYLYDDRAVLCLYRLGSRVADHLYIGSAGGHFEEGELNDPKACVLREMREELNLTEAEISGLTLRYITMRLKNGEIRQNYYFFARLNKPRDLTSTEGILRWVPWENVEALEMPGSAKHMLLHYRDMGRYTSHIYGGITQQDHTDFVLFQEF